MSEAHDDVMRRMYARETAKLSDQLQASRLEAFDLAARASAEAQRAARRSSYVRHDAYPTLGDQRQNAYPAPYEPIARPSRMDYGPEDTHPSDVWVPQGNRSPVGSNYGPPRQYEHNRWGDIRSYPPVNDPRRRSRSPVSRTVENYPQRNDMRQMSPHESRREPRDQQRPGPTGNYDSNHDRDLGRNEGGDQGHRGRGRRRRRRDRIGGRGLDREDLISQGTVDTDRGNAASADTGPSENDNSASRYAAEVFRESFIPAYGAFPRWTEPWDHYCLAHSSAHQQTASGECVKLYFTKFGGRIGWYAGIIPWSMETTREAVRSCSELNATLKSYIGYKAHRDILLSQLYSRVVSSMTPVNHDTWKRFVILACCAVEKLFLLLTRELATFIGRQFTYCRKQASELQGKSDAEVEAAVASNAAVGEIKVQRQHRFLNELRNAVSGYATSRMNLTADLYAFFIASGLSAPDQCYMFRFVERCFPSVKVPPEFGSYHDLVSIPDMESLEKKLLAYSTELSSPTADQIAEKMAAMEGKGVVDAADSAS